MVQIPRLSFYYPASVDQIQKTTANIRENEINDTIREAISRKRNGKREALGIRLISSVDWLKSPGQVFTIQPALTKVWKTFANIRENEINDTIMETISRKRDGKREVLWMRLLKLRFPIAGRVLSRVFEG